MDNQNEKKYATIADVSAALEKLEAKMPSRWEVRALILGAIVVSNYNVPDEVTTAAIAAGAIGLIGKTLSAIFLRS